MAGNNKLTNPALERMRSGDVALGVSVRTSRSGDIARLARASGHDFLFIDAQHALYDLETIGHIANVAIAVGVAPLVRVRSVDDPDVPLLLDCGVQGIVFPDVNTADEARRAVDRCRFPPVGKRSVSGSFVNFDYRSVPLADAIAELQATCLVACMIETPEGLANAEAIAAVKGVDVVHLGTNDLLVSLGLAGQFDHPAAVEAQQRVIAAAKANGIFAGCGGNRDVERQAAAIRNGAQFVTTQADTAFMMAAANQWTQGVRRLLG